MIHNMLHLTVTVIEEAIVRILILEVLVLDMVDIEVMVDLHILRQPTILAPTVLLMLQFKT
jgi:hypothetical protein